MIGARFMYAHFFPSHFICFWFSEIAAECRLCEWKNVEKKKFEVDEKKKMAGIKFYGFQFCLFHLNKIVWRRVFLHVDRIICASIIVQIHLIKWSHDKNASSPFFSNETKRAHILTLQSVRQLRHLFLVFFMFTNIRALTHAHDWHTQQLTDSSLKYWNRSSVVLSQYAVELKRFHPEAKLIKSLSWNVVKSLERYYRRNTIFLSYLTFRFAHSPGRMRS